MPTICLSQHEHQTVCSILRKVLVPQGHSSILQAWVFGSRSTGHARPYSDLDILVTEPKALDWRMRADLQDAFEASDLPFRVDVVEEARLAPGIAQRVLAERAVLI